MSRFSSPFAACLVLAAVILARDASADGAYVALCNKANTRTTISRSDLKKVLTGGTKLWPNGEPVQVGIYAADVPEMRYLAASVGLSPSELLSRIQQQVFKGEMRRPIVLRSAAECVALARSSPGAICPAPGGVPLPPEAHAVGVE